MSAMQMINELYTGVEALLGSEAALPLLDTIDGVSCRLASAADVYLEYARLVGLAGELFDANLVRIYVEAYRSNPLLHLPPRLNHLLDPASEAGQALGRQMAADLAEAGRPGGASGVEPQDPTPTPTGDISSSTALWGALGCVALGIALAQLAPGCLALAL